MIFNTYYKIEFFEIGAIVITWYLSKLILTEFFDVQTDPLQHILFCKYNVACWELYAPYCGCQFFRRFLKTIFGNFLEKTEMMGEMWSKNFCTLWRWPQELLNSLNREEIWFQTYKRQSLVWIKYPPLWLVVCARCKMSKNFFKRHIMSL